MNLNEKLKLFLRRVENIVGKGENAGYQHFLLFTQYFSKEFSFRVVKRRKISFKRVKYPSNDKIMNFTVLVAFEIKQVQILKSDFKIRKAWSENEESCFQAFSLFVRMLSKTIFTEVFENY